MLLSTIDAQLVCLETGSIAGARALLAEHEDLPLCILDLTLQQESGLSAIRMLKELRPSLAVVVVSGTEDPGVVRECIDALDIAVAGPLARSAHDLTLAMDVLSTPLRSFDETLRTALDFLGEPHKLWASERIEDKRAVLKLAFAGRLAYNGNEGFRTANPSFPFKMLESISPSNMGMARPEGLEPPTPGLEGRCSIRLSYGRGVGASPVDTLGRLRLPGRGLVGVTGFEPATSCSQSRRATGLRYSPNRRAA